MVLLFIFTDPRAQIDFDACAELTTLQQRQALRKGQFERSLAFWRGAGVIESDHDADDDEEIKAAHNRKQDSITVTGRAKAASVQPFNLIATQKANLVRMRLKKIIKTEKDKEKARKKRPKKQPAGIYL